MADFPMYFLSGFESAEKREILKAIAYIATGVFDTHLDSVKVGIRSDYIALKIAFKEGGKKRVVNYYLEGCDYFAALKEFLSEDEEPFKVLSEIQDRNPEVRPARR
ncbi:MAG: hypothetical protein HKM06_08610 [Spirochaetales bacterium]|nr:hypothetical protein [Spirochaetales bacterium]